MQWRRFMIGLVGLVLFGLGMGSAYTVLRLRYPLLTPQQNSGAVLASPEPSVTDPLAAAHPSPGATLTPMPFPTETPTMTFLPTSTATLPPTPPAYLTYDANGTTFGVDLVDGVSNALGTSSPHGNVMDEQRVFWIVQSDFTVRPYPFQIMASTLDGGQQTLLLSSDAFYAQFPQNSVQLVALTLAEDSQHLFFEACGVPEGGGNYFLQCGIFGLDTTTGSVEDHYAFDGTATSIAPDGKRAFGSRTLFPPGSQKYFAAHLFQDSNAHQLNQAEPGGVAWLADGRFVYSVRSSDRTPLEGRDDGNRLILADRDGNTIHVIARDVGLAEIAVTPDKEQLVYLTDRPRELWLTNLDGTSQRRIAVLPDDATGLTWRRQLAVASPTSSQQPAEHSRQEKRECFHEFCFTYDAALATNVSAMQVPKVAFIGPEQPGGPEHIEFHFEGYPVNSNLVIAELSVWPATGYAAGEYPYRPETAVDALRTLLSDRPELHGYLFSPATSLPVPLPNPLPPINAERFVAVKQSYLDWLDGSGVRSISMFSQDDTTIRDDTLLLYLFQGLSRDGQYYISASFQVEITMPAETHSRAWQRPPEWSIEQRDEYIQPIVEQLDQSPDGLYRPALDLLDAVARSITIGARGGGATAH